MTDVKVLLFDLGGVLLRLNDPMETFGLSTDESAFLSTWPHLPAVREFERGAISAGDFAERIVVEADLSYDATEFLERFDAWPDELYPGVLDLLDRIPATFRTGLLSNTNAVHWQRSGVANELEHRFEKVFLSYVTGLLKPDHEVFTHVVAEFACDAGEVLFFDDNPANIHVARQRGCQAILTKGIHDLRRSLEKLGI